MDKLRKSIMIVFMFFVLLSLVIEFVLSETMFINQGGYDR